MSFESSYRLQKIRRLEAEANKLRREAGLPEVDYDEGLKSVAPREWGLTNIFERDPETDEFFVKIDSPEKNDLMVIGTNERMVAGIDFYYDHIDFGIWVGPYGDAEWQVISSVGPDGKEFEHAAMHAEPTL